MIVGVRKRPRRNVLAGMIVALAFVQVAWGLSPSATGSGGTVVTGYWNSTNTAVIVSFTTPDSADYNGGSAYIYRVIGGTKTGSGHPVSGLLSNTAYNESVPAAFVETVGFGFQEGATMTFRIEYYNPGFLNAESAAETFFIDQIAPSAPINLDLQSGDDTGAYNNDNITTTTQPNFDFAGLTAGHTITLRFDGAWKAQTTAAGATGSLAPGTPQDDGSYSVTVAARDTAGNTSNASIAVALTIDNVAPDPPNVPDLQSSSDSGYDDTDDITSDVTPTFTISGISSSELIRLYSDAGSTLIASGWSSGTTRTLTSIALGEATYGVTAKSEDRAGNVSNLSGALTLTVDTTPPGAPLAPDLTTDTGLSPNDDITNDTTPSFLINGLTTTNLISLKFNGVEVDTGIATSTGITLTATTQLDGDYTINASQTDPAGNTSALSPSLDITIDSAVPSTPNTPDLDNGSDTGRSTSDDITNDVTPTINVSGVSANDRVTLQFNGVTVAFEDASSTTVAITASTQSHGTYSVTAFSTDVAGNVSGTSSALSVDIDTQAPTPPGLPDLQPGSDTGTSTTDDITKDTTPTLDIAGVTSGDSIFVEVDASFKGGLIASGTSVTITANPLDPGTLAVTAKAVDVAGNTSNASSTLTLTLDTTPPAPPSAPDLAAGDDSGLSSTDDTTNVTTPTHTVGGVTTGHGVALLFDGASVATGVASGTSIDLAPSVTQADGSYDVTAAATDVAGNTSNESAALTIVIDTQAPTAPGKPDLQPGSDSGVSSTDDLTNDNTPTFTIASVTASHQIDLNFDGVSEADGIATTGSITLTPAGAIVDGVYTVTATATDVAGNLSAASTGLSVTIDTAPPGGPDTPDLDAGSDLGSSSTDDITKDDTPTITVTGINVGDSIAVRFDGVEKASGTATGSSISLTSSTLADAVYAVTATATDPAGNTSSASGDLSLTIDTTPPDTPVIPDLLPASDTGVSTTDNITNDDTPTFRITDGDGISAGDLVSLVFDGVAVASGTAVTTSIDITPASQSEGTYDVKARVYDVAGNPSGLSPLLNLNLDLTGPDVALSYSDTLVKETDPIAITATFSEPGAATPTIDIDYAGTGSDVSADPMTLGASDSLWTYDTAAPAGNDGTAAVSITGTDLAGNTASVISGAADLEVDNTVPVISSVAPADSSYHNSTEVSYTLSEDIVSGSITWTRLSGASDPGAPHVQALTGSELGTGAHTDITLTNDPTLVSGTVYSITFAGEDGAGNSATSVVSSPVTFDNVAPQADLTYSDTLAHQGDLVTITATMTEAAATTPQPPRITVLFAGGSSVGPVAMTATADPAVWTYDATMPLGNDGAATVTINTADLAGNALTPGNTTGANDLVVDNIAPGYVLSYSDSLVKASDVVTITATFDEPVDASPLLSINYAGTGADTSGIAMSSPGPDSIWSHIIVVPTGNDGYANVSVSATDYAGNTATHVSGSTAMLVDNTFLTLTASSPDSGDYVSTTAVSYSLSETAASGSITWIWSSGVSDIAAPHAQTLTASELTVGAHTGILTNPPALVSSATYNLRYIALDAAGNSDTVETYSVTYDTLSPRATLSYSDSLAAEGDTVTITLVLSEAALNVPAITVRYDDITRPSGAAMSATADSLIWTYQAVMPADNDGTVTVEITAADLAGNVLTTGNTTGSTDLIVDNTAPGYVLSYNDSLVTAGQTVEITATFLESVKDTPRIAIDFAGTGADTSGADMTMGANDSVWVFEVDIPTGNDGFVTVTVTAYDLVDNLSVAVSGNVNTLKVDNTPPEIAPSYPEPDDFVRNTEVAYTLDETIQSGQVIWTREAGTADAASPHAQALTGPELNSGSHTGEITNDPTLVQGTAYTLQFIAVDELGNADTAEVTTVTYDTLAPGIQSAVVYDGGTTDLDSIQFIDTDSITVRWAGFSEPVSDIVLYEYAMGTTRGGSDLIDWTENSTDTTVIVTGLELVRKLYYYFSVRATDGAGNVSDSVTSDGVRIVDVPEMTVNVVQNSVLTDFIQVFANDTLGMADSARLVIDTLQVDLTEIDTFVYVGTYKLDTAGTHAIAVTGFSWSGNDTATSSFGAALAKSGQSWIAASADRRFIITGSPRSVHDDRYLLVVDSTLMGSAKSAGAEYRLGDGQFVFDEPVQVSMLPGIDRATGATEAQAIYILHSDGRWEELPTLDDGERVSTWARSAGTFRLGKRTIIVPRITSLHPNYPNPFNPTTKIVFDLGFMDGLSQHATVVVYNLLGQQVRTLYNGEALTGRHELVWRGINDQGAAVASGIYFVRLSTSTGYQMTRKMLLVR
ncbi:MAG: T9SS type A sorting domain-containing protein [Fidelibacterota bacterium]|nr:MAG: T9SS type A sorting domain-containing protein [Candidatus Neomarinimicrobiota bacterium]